MSDDTQTPGAEPQRTGQETSTGEASDWSTIPPAEPLTPPAQSLEPLPPQPPQNVPPSPPSQYGAPPSSGYQPVYGSQAGSQAGSQPGSQPQPPGGYANAPSGGDPPPPPNAPPGYGSGPQYPPPPPAVGQGLSSHAAAAISYLTFIPAVLFLVIEPYNRDRFVRFHAWQCIALTIVAVCIGIVFHILGVLSFHLLWWLMMLINMAIRLILFVFWLIALIKASQGQWYKIPIVGDLAASFAGPQQ